MPISIPPNEVETGPGDKRPPMPVGAPRFHRVALFGGLYNNYLALEAAIANAQSRRVEQIFCLGDLGAFGPFPDRIFPLIEAHQIKCARGNYDDSIGRGLGDCQCGYTDSRDNYFATLSYEYTLRNTSPANREFLRNLPGEIRFMLGSQRVLLCHGSPRRTNEFLWESTTSNHFLESLFRNYEADIICVTHTGLKWHRRLASGCLFVNVGVLGRPENDGTPLVWYTVLEASASEGVRVEFVPVAYDHERLAKEMEAEQIPAEFVATTRTGWWTTCLEVLPTRERRRGKF